MRITQKGKKKSESQRMIFFFLIEKTMVQLSAHLKATGEELQPRTEVFAVEQALQSRQAFYPYLTLL